jgi:hypothetical protein
MFRRRRQKDGSSAPSGADAAPTSPLIERLREIGQAAVAPEDALEPALRAIVEAIGAGAGALCLFDPRYGVLRLAAESGLSDEGCKRLRNVRRGDPTSWDMPLHGVLNKRAYLIESAARNRYVPHLVENHAAVRTVICVPVYSGPAPLATVVLLATGSRSFTENDIRTLERPLRELGKLVEAVRRRVAPVLEAYPSLLGVPQDYSGIVEERDHLRAEMASRFAEHASLVSELQARTQENDRLRLTIERLTEDRAQLQASLEQGRGSTERVEELGDALSAAERERARLAAALEAAALERSEAARRESALDSARAEAQRIARETAAELEAAKKALGAAKMDAAAEIDERTAEKEALQAYVAELEAAAERERALARDRQREQERLASELRAANAREQQMRVELESSVQRAEAGRNDDVREALAQVRAAEESRAALIAEAEAARAAIAEQRAAYDKLEAETARMRGELVRWEAAGATHHTDEQRLETALGDAQARARAAEARLAELELHASTLRESGNRNVADSRERAAELAAISAHLESVAAERDRLRESRAAVESERDGLMSELAASAAKLNRVEETLVREAGERERLAEALAVAQAALEALESSRPAPSAEARSERPIPGGEAGAPGAGGGASARHDARPHGRPGRRAHEGPRRRGEAHRRPRRRPRLGIGGDRRLRGPRGQPGRGYGGRDVRDRAGAHRREPRGAGRDGGGGGAARRGLGGEGLGLHRRRGRGACGADRHRRGGGAAARLRRDPGHPEGPHEPRHARRDGRRRRRHADEPPPGDGAPRHVGVDGVGREAGDGPAHRRPPRGRRDRPRPAAAGRVRHHRAPGDGGPHPVRRRRAREGRRDGRVHRDARAGRHGRPRRPARSTARRCHRSPGGGRGARAPAEDPRRRPKVAEQIDSHGWGP